MNPFPGNGKASLIKFKFYSMVHCCFTLSFSLNLFYHGYLEVVWGLGVKERPLLLPILMLATRLSLFNWQFFKGFCFSNIFSLLFPDIWASLVSGFYNDFRLFVSRTLHSLEPLHENQPITTQAYLFLQSLATGCKLSMHSNLLCFSSRLSQNYSPEEQLDHLPSCRRQNFTKYFATAWYGSPNFQPARHVCWSLTAWPLHQCNAFLHF